MNRKLHAIFASLAILSSVGATADTILTATHGGVVFGASDSKALSLDRSTFMGPGTPIPMVKVTRKNLIDAVRQSMNATDLEGTAIGKALFTEEILANLFTVCAFDPETEREICALDLGEGEKHICPAENTESHKNTCPILKRHNEMCPFAHVRIKKGKSKEGNDDSIEIMNTRCSHNSTLVVSVDRALLNNKIIEAISNFDNNELAVISGKNIKNISKEKHSEIALEEKQRLLKLQATEIKSDRLKWAPRTTGELKFNLPGTITLIDDSKIEGVSGTISAVHQGGANPFQGWLMRDSSYYQIALNAYISSYALDVKSAITLSWNGASSQLSKDSLVALTGFSFQTSQSLQLSSGYFDWMWRLGDRRANGKNYYEPDTEPAPIYFDFGLQFGLAYSMLVNDVQNGSYRGFAPIARPSARLGFSKGDIFGGEFNASIRTFYLLGNFSGTSLNEELREVFDVSLKLGGEKSNLTLSVSGGTNPASGFQKISPTYSITGKFKF